MHPRTEKHPKRLGSNAQNLVCVPVTPSYSESVQLQLDPPKDLNQFVDLYDSRLRGLINNHSP